MFKQIHLAAVDSSKIIGEEYHMWWWVFYPLWFVTLLVCVRALDSFQNLLSFNKQNGV